MENQDLTPMRAVPTRALSAGDRLRDPKGRSSAPSGLAELLAAAAVTAFLVPAYYAWRYPRDIAVTVPAVAGLSLALLGTVFGVLWLVFRLLERTGGGGEAGRFARFCLAWSLLAGFVFPLVHGGGMAEAHEMPTRWVNVFVVLALSLACALAFDAARPGVLVGASVLSALACLGAVSRATTGAGSDSEGLARLGTLSARENLIVLSFDGLPGHFVQELRDAGDPLLDELRDFTWFADAVSTSPATTASMVSELFGNRDFRAVASSEAQLLSRLDWSSLFFNGTDDDVRLYGSGAYEAASPGRHVRLPMSGAAGSRLLSTVSFLNVAVARVWSNQAARLVRGLAGRLSGAVGAATFYRGPSWKEPLLGDRQALDALTLSLGTGDAPLSVRLMHFAHTHYPPDFDARGVLRGTEPGWHESQRNPAALLDQTRFALSQAVRFLSGLRGLGLYDRSLVVIKSDHGEPPGFFDTAPWNLRIRDHPLWGYCRYRPLLLVKERGARRAKMRVDGRLVTLGDLARTLCNARAHPAKDCSAFPGLDLLSDAPPSTEEPWIFLDVVRDARSSHRFEDHETVRLDRRRGLLEQLREKGLVTD